MMRESFWRNSLAWSEHMGTYANMNVWRSLILFWFVYFCTFWLVFLVLFFFFFACEIISDGYVVVNYLFSSSHFSSVFLFISYQLTYLYLFIYSYIFYWFLGLSMYVSSFVLHLHILGTSVIQQLKDKKNILEEILNFPLFFFLVNELDSIANIYHTERTLYSENFKWIFSLITVYQFMDLHNYWYNWFITCLLVHFHFSYHEAVSTRIYIYRNKFC